MNVVITGASRGIGYELAKIFVTAERNHVVAVARSERKLKKLTEESSGTIANTSSLDILGFDLVNDDYQKVFIPFITEKLGTVDILINNAGFLVAKDFDQLTDEDFDRMFNTNVKSVFKLTQALLPFFSGQAHIVNISSMGGVQGSAKFKGLSLYSASKGALNILTECLAEELKEKNISVNALALGAVQTEMLSEAFPGYRAPLQPDEMAKFIMDFAVDGNRFFNGKILPASLSTP
ncbi:MAG: SDR family oxidoreductase [Chlorobi bacterium]|nr:SDR family oxidoreductase [Chlorobiota bacterium]